MVVLICVPTLFVIASLMSGILLVPYTKPFWVPPGTEQFSEATTTLPIKSAELSVIFKASFVDNICS